MKTVHNRTTIAIATALLIVGSFLMILWTSPSMLVGINSPKPIELSIDRADTDKAIDNDNIVSAESKTTPEESTAKTDSYKSSESSVNNKSDVSDNNDRSNRQDNNADIGIINLNTATAEQLMTLPNLGEVLASRIIDYREQYGSFAAVEDLISVSGVGEKRLTLWRPYLTV